MKKVYVIIGPTASGKTGIAIELAKKLDGEIISADSMQIYKYLDIGTAKPNAEEQKAAKHHMIDFVNPNDSFNVVTYQSMVKKLLEEITSRNHVPIIAGGTGLYINSIIYGIDFSKSSENSKLREKLYDLAKEKGNQHIYDILLDISPELAKSIHPNNIKRVIRAIEIAKLDKAHIKKDMFVSQIPLPYEFEIFFLNMDREKLYERINLRVDEMMKNGLLEETNELIRKGIIDCSQAMQAIGYKEMMPYINGDMTLEESINILKRNTRRYAKRQITWFKKIKEAKVVNPLEYNSKEEIIDKIINWNERN